MAFVKTVVAEGNKYIVDLSCPFACKALFDCAFSKWNFLAVDNNPFLFPHCPAEQIRLS
jgi:hypothetical protein